MLYGAIILLATLNQNAPSSLEKYNFDLGGAVAPVVESQSPSRAPVKSVSKHAEKPKPAVVSKPIQPARPQPVYQYYYNPYQYNAANCVGFT